MKQISLLLLIFVLIGCSQKQNETGSIADSNTEIENSVSLNEKLNNLFGKVDSTEILKSIGCVQGYFAHISSEFVIRIPPSIYSDYESEKEYNLVKDGIQCQLLVFEKDSSHLANICTDIIIANYPKPKRELNSIQGKIKVFIGNKQKLWGNQINNAYIRIENMEFIDTLNNNRKIEIKDKYLWKVLNLGTPG